MKKLADQRYLLEEQYKDAANLNARARLHARFSTNPHGWHRWVFDQFDLPSRCRILELGCGPGLLWKQNIDRIPSDWDITLSDFSPGMVREAQDNLRDSLHPFAFQVIDAQNIPPGDQRFDAVIANHMLYHLPDREKAFAEIWRVLEPGGHLYAATNGKGHHREFMEWVKRVKANFRDPSILLHEYFSLESGRAELSRWFVDVDLHLYEDTLEITEIEPLVAYVVSMGGLDDEQIREFGRFAEEEIRRRGAIHVTKNAGLFTARRGGACSQETEPLIC